MPSAGSDAEVQSAAAGARLEPGQLEARFPWGRFLAEGAFKQVYHVWNSQHSRQEAISVMDLQAIASDGCGESMAVLAQEIQVGMLASALVRHRICPHFVETFGFFNCAEMPAPTLWGTAEDPAPRGKMPVGRRGGRKAAAAAKPRYQFIGMELCELGDVEGYLRELPRGVLPVEDTVAVLFQMLFSIFAARHEYRLRHYDLKLLNFLVSRRAKVPCAAVEQTDQTVSVVQCGIDEHVFDVRMSANHAVLIKLADFGTSDVNSDTFNEPIGVDHFTTLENTAPELLLHGSQAVQGYALDTFAAGLAALHLFTGQAPYEELMDEVQCPAKLRVELRKAWSRAPQFDVVVATNKRLMDSSSDESDEDEDNTLYNTLYRYFVLLGVPGQSGVDSNSAAEHLQESSIWRAAVQVLVPSTVRGKTRKGQDAAVISKFRTDQAKFSIATGTAPCMVRARGRMAAIPGALELVQSMLEFLPERRPTMLRLLKSEVFSGLRVAHAMSQPHVAGYTCFYRGAHADGEYSSRPPLLDV
ncbi:kinase-like domain-containing protein [Tribonema minus]|uniref:Kinase-like domain-containing protein n=1 Tax=Tribonema minus TaxID=303371 RepID=A0A835ZET0_9STRA|nr:kinase-like domain-containing protein [Tribonema minus]